MSRMRPSPRRLSARPAPRAAVRGLSLIELMIAMMLGLLVVASASAIFLSNRQTYRATEGLGRVQESGRMAFELMARDLREILAGLRIPSDIERIGDDAANVAKRSIALNVSPPVPHTSSLRALGQLAARQVSDVLEAYRDGDAERALKVRARDAELDAQYTALFRELLTYMMEDARNITPCTHLLFMAKNLERIGDHATNIAENVWFLVHGDQPLPPRDKRDETSTTGAV